MVAASYSPLLYIANASVLIAHQIDAAFWREWEMLGIPGGNPVNLFLNLPILAAVLYAHREATLETSCAHLAHRFLASLGYITVAVHSYFYFGRGATQFVEPVSIGLIVATAVLSTLQFAASRASDRSKGSAAS